MAQSLENCKWCGRQYDWYKVSSGHYNYCSPKCQSEANAPSKSSSKSSSKSTSSSDGCGKIVAWIILILIIWAILHTNGVL